MRQRKLVRHGLRDQFSHRLVERFVELLAGDELLADAGDDRDREGEMRSSFTRRMWP